MMGLGEHAAFIIASYAFAGIAILGLLAWIVADGAKLKRAVVKLEAGGARRRSRNSGAGGGQS